MKYFQTYFIREPLFCYQSQVSTQQEKQIIGQHPFANNVNIPNIILAKLIEQHNKRIIYHDQLKLFSGMLDE